MAALPVFKIVLFAAWMLGPLVCVLLLQLPGWIYADDLSLQWSLSCIGLVVGLCWVGVMIAMLLSSPHFDLRHQNVRSLGFIAFGTLFFSWVAASSVTGLVFGLLNCAADRSKGQEAVVKGMGGEFRTVFFRIEQPFFATFKCNQATWSTALDEGRRFFVHPGRLGAVWGEFR